MRFRQALREELLSSIVTLIDKKHSGSVWVTVRALNLFLQFVFACISSLKVIYPNLYCIKVSCTWPAMHGEGRDSKSVAANHESNFLRGKMYGRPLKP